MKPDKNTMKKRKNKDTVLYIGADSHVTGHISH